MKGYVRTFFNVKSVNRITANAGVWACVCTDFEKHWTKLINKYYSNPILSDFFLQFIHFEKAFQTFLKTSSKIKIRVVGLVYKGTSKNCLIEDSDNISRSLWSKIFRNSCKNKVKFPHLQFTDEKLSIMSSWIKVFFMLGIQNRWKKKSVW